MRFIRRSLSGNWRRSSVLGFETPGLQESPGVGQALGSKRPLEFLLPGEVVAEACRYPAAEGVRQVNHEEVRWMGSGEGSEGGEGEKRKSPLILHG
jgi:hypothetical protein